MQYTYERIHERLPIQSDQKNPFQHLERASIDVKIIKIEGEKRARGGGEPYIGESEAGSECSTRGDVTES